MSHPATVQRASLAVRRDDLYETPACAVHALLKVEAIPPGVVWECACGPGAIARTLRANGFQVWSTDLVDYSSPDQDAHGIDYLMEHGSAPFSIGSIISNPPYKLADQFARHALLLCPRVYMLLRLNFIESQRRTVILESGWLRRVYVFKNRLPMMHRAGWDGPRATSTTAYAWFCWRRDDPGPTELCRIAWEPES